MKLQDLRIVAFGDSTTAPRDGVVVYAELLPALLAAQGIRAEVVNAGVGGDTTQLAKARFERDVLARPADLVIIQFGINDSVCDVWKEPPAREPRVPLELYERNLVHFVEAAQARGTRAVLLTPNPLRWTPQLKELYGKPPYDPDDPDGLNALLRPYVAVVRQVAQAHSLPLVDVFAAFEAYGQKQNGAVDALLLDGMHPNSAGQQVVAALLAACLAEIIRPLN